MKKKILPQLEIPFQFDSEENFAEFIRDTEEDSLDYNTEEMCENMFMPKKVMFKLRIQRKLSRIKEQSAKPSLPLKKHVPEGPPEAIRKEIFKSEYRERSVPTELLEKMSYKDFKKAKKTWPKH